MVSQGERPFAVGILLQWFWSGVTLTGNETRLCEEAETKQFWNSVVLAGNETAALVYNRLAQFWSGATLTG